MKQSMRKLVGTFATLAVLVLYVAAAVAIHLAFFAGLATPLQLVYFAIAGLGWAIPTGIIIRWMAKPDAT